jgi:hypothetical protein
VATRCSCLLHEVLQAALLGRGIVGEKEAELMQRALVLAVLGYFDVFQWCGQNVVADVFQVALEAASALHWPFKRG